MATALAAQLVQLQSHSSNSLDLRAQRKAHSQSLLFDPGEAATQDFDSIYQICYNGFEQLCSLDARFSSFAETLFSEQSKDQDRNQMTSAQNNELDIVLEDFILMVGRRLALEAAIQAVEWAVRRFRAHERNTLSLTLAFLPYHMTPSFANLLAILPRRLPEELKFLHPYIQSTASPSRHTIVYTASNNKNFLLALSRGVLRSCVKEYQYPALVSFWASITTEAIATMLDQAKSTRREAHARTQEDILLFILPILNHGISIKDASELRIGCYMILTVLASKATLEENVLLAMMEAVTSNWERVSHAGLICLAVLAQQRRQYRLPVRVMKALRSLPSIEHDLQFLSKQYEVDRLVLGIVINILEEFIQSGDSKELHQMRRLLESGLMHERSSTTAFDAVLSTIDKADSVGNHTTEGSGSSADLVLLLSDSKQIRAQIQHAVIKSSLPLVSLRQILGVATEASASRSLMLHVLSARKDERSIAIEDFESITKRLSIIKAREISFLSHPVSDTYDTLADAFCSIHTSQANLERFSDLPVLGKTLAMIKPLFMSFYIRLWCGSSLATARAAALQTIIAYLENSIPTTFPQILLPYVFHALSDPSLLVRQAAADLVLVLSRTYAKIVEPNGSSDNGMLFPLEQIYGPIEHPNGVEWLSAKDVNQFVADLLVPYLEEYLLDHQAILHLLSLAIAGPKSNNKLHTKACPELKTSRRLSIFSFLCRHVVLSPLYAFKFRMLRVLNRIDKVGSTSRTTLLLPLLSATASFGNEKISEACQSESIDFPDFLQELVCTVTPHDREGVQKLEQIMKSGDLMMLNVAALRRMSSIWPRLKPDLQLSVAAALLDLAVDGGSGNNGQTLQHAALEAFLATQISTAVLQHLLAQLPMLSSCSQDKQPPSKRRRTSHGQVDASTEANQPRMEQGVRRIALVLEKLQTSHETQHPALVKGLFQTLADLKDAQSQSGHAISYLHLLAMDTILAIVKRAKDVPDLPLDTTAVRMDVLIDYIRTVADPQVRNTAFLLIAGLADIAPEVVLHSVMPIFTHMGANLLRQVDDFSAYVIKQTMDSIIPRLVKSLHNGSAHAFAGVCELLLNFAAAFEHIPQQRRLDIFASLVIKIGPFDYLFALFAILCSKYPGNRRVLDLSSQLSGHQSIQVQLQTMDKCLHLVLQTWDSPSTDSPFAFLLDLCQSAEAFTMNILPLVILVLQSDELRLKITTALSKETSDANAIRTSIGGILEQVFQLSLKCRSRRRLHPLITKVVDVSLDLLPLPDLVMTLEGVLTRGNDDVNRRVLQSFVDRLDSQTSDAQAAQGPCIAFLPQLVKIIQGSADLILRQVAVSAIERIVDKFGKTDLSSVVQAAQDIAAKMCLATEVVTLRVASLHCLAHMIEVSGEAIVPVIPSTLPGVGQNLELSISQDTENRSLHNACYTVYQALLHYVPRMITGHDLVRILELSYESANADMGADCDLNRKTTLHIIARHVEVRELFTTLERTWTAAVIEGPKAVSDHFELLRLAVDSQPKAVVKQQSEALGGLLIKAFSLRQAQLCPRTDDSYSDDAIEEAEAAMNDTAIAIIYKLNDASFRPMFRRLLEWATSRGGDSQSSVYRRSTWYTFLDHFFRSLKSIVTSYAGLIIEDAMDLLGQDVRPGDQEYMRLWRKVVQTLQSTFEHDQDEFYQIPAHFTPISTALLSQLSHAAQISMTAEIIPAIVELAVATDSSSQQKDMNAAILKYMRSDIVSIRLAAVQCERALTDRLGEDWLAMLPEMLPFISELQEDDDETVEKETLRWISRIEEILGESLTPMLQ